MEEIRLYEFDYDKPELSEDFLADNGIIKHHQALGAHWGIHNGPPYPLSRKLSTGKRLTKNAKGVSKRKARKIQKNRVKSLKKARKVREQNRQVQQEQQKSKEEILKTKDLAAMSKNSELFTTQEINDMLNRLSTEDRLKEAAGKQAEANKTRAQKVADKIKTSIKKNAEEASTNLLNQALKKGTDMALKKAAVEIAKTSGPETEKVVKQLLGIQDQKDQGSKKWDPKDAENMLKNKSKYSTKDLSEMVARINAESNLERLVEERKKKK